MGFLLPSGPNIKTEGPRLESLQTTDSAYGNDIPIPFGTVRLGGNVIWSTDLTEQKVTSTQSTGGKGGGGGGSQTTTTYLYYVSFAVCFGEGVARDILRIWADGKLLYNAKAGSSQGTKDGVNFRFYPGDETQLADSAIVADRGAQAPAHRGLCYVVFDNLPLQDFGNRIPSITAEINFESRQNEVIDTDIQSVGTPTVRGNAITVDWARDRMYLEAQDQSEISVFSLSTLTKVQSLPFYNIRGVMRGSGEILAVDQTTTPDTDLLLNPFSGSIVKSTQRVVVPGGGFEPSENYFASGGVGLTLATQYGDFRVYVGRGEQSNVPEFRFWDVGEDLEFIDRLTAPDNTYEHVTLADVSANSGFALGGFWSPDEILIYSFQVGVDVGTFGGMSAELNTSLVKTITPSEVHPDATAFSITGGGSIYTVIDETSAALLFGIGTDAGKFVVRVEQDGSIAWSVQVPFVRINTTAESDSRVSGGAWAYHNGNAIVRVNVATGTLDPELDGTQSLSNLGYDGSFFDDNRNAIYNLNQATGATEFRRHLLGGRAGQNVRMVDVIDRISERVGIQPVADSDVSSITDEIEGFIVDSRMSAKKALEPLALLGFFDCVERDGKLVYVPRGGGSQVTIPEDDFVRTKQNRTEQYTEKRVQEAELPSVFNVDYLDPENDYQENTQSARRILAPDFAVKSDNSDSVDVPAVITRDRAKQMAEKLLYTNWLERTMYKARLPQKYLYLDPSDAAVFSLNNGFTFRGRLDEFDIGKDFSINTEIARENVGQYISTVSADGGGTLEQEIPVISPTQAFFLDIPLLRDVDALQGTAHRGYFAGNNFGQGGWPGCVVSKSVDGSTWDTLTQQLDGIPWGIATTTLGNPDSYWRTDETNTVDVIMVDGGDELESITDLELVNGSNAFLLIKSNGEVGICQFRDVEALGNNTFRLSGLLRGRRGSDTMDRDYGGNELFLLISQNRWLEGFSLSLAERSLSRFYRPTTIGQLFEATPTETFTHTGRDHKPYAPVNPTAVVSGNDVTLGWTRRTRLGDDNDLADGGDGTVPVAETSEAYDLLLRNAYGAVARTVTDITEPTRTYLNADMVADRASQRYELSITNGGFETDATSGWTQDGGGGTPLAANTDVFVEGSQSFAGWSGTTDSSQYQDVTISSGFHTEIDTGECAIVFRAFQLNALNAETTPQDPGQIEVQCLDVSDVVLATFTSDLVKPATWTQVEASGTVPANTRTFRIRIRGTYDLGSNINVYFDNLTLDLFTTEIPSTLSFDVYQKSGTVGRGFAGEFTDVEVTT